MGQKRKGEREGCVQERVSSKVIKEREKIEHQPSLLLFAVFETVLLRATIRAIECEKYRDLQVKGLQILSTEKSARLASFCLASPSTR
ncbi:hypothetical protein CesoFtcFv8_017476 [Champsocephalus esox]|uniref:Uncharacterized protein n=1 Tax=Champsocephalus esox TaxID=159716 RepID=A0AAN8GQS7_9TELE|nr:hypothetical protein CesoFtcFv8_017476 [Champsocephalus esox]